MKTMQWSDLPELPHERPSFRWYRVNDDAFEYAIQEGPHGDEFVKLPDGKCLRRPKPEFIQ